MMLQRTRDRRGFALVAVLMILVLLLTFLMAAQGSVMNGRLQMKRSADRSDSGEKINNAVMEMRDRLRRETTSGAKKPGDAWQYGNGDAILLLTADDPIYADLPLIAHRDGDALLTHVEIIEGAEKKSQYLINATPQRAGAIRIR